MGDVDPEACDAAIQPEPKDALELRAHIGVPPVEIRLLAGEVVQVVAAALSVELPSRAAAEDRLPVVGNLVRPDVVRGALAEPRMLVGGVVRDEIEQDADSAPPCLGDELVQIRESSEVRVDAGVVRDVVSPVDVRRGVDRVQPDPVDAEPLEVLELSGDPAEIPDPVAVRVGERPGVDLVEDALSPPRLACQMCSTATCNHCAYILATCQEGERMAEITYEGVSKVYDDGTWAVEDLDLAIEDGELMVLVGSFGLRQDDGVADARRARGDHRREIRIGDQRRQRPSPEGARHRDGLPELRALPAHDGRATISRSDSVPQAAEVGDRTSASGEAAETLQIEEFLEAGSRRRSRAGSDSASRWGVRSCASRRRS